MIFAGIDASSYHSHHFYLKENEMQFSCVGWCLNVYSMTSLLFNTISNSIDSLQYRCTLVCVSLFYYYYNRFCSNEISGFISENHMFLCNTRLSRRALSYVVNWSVDRSIFYGQNSFFSKTIRIWNSSLPRGCNYFWLLRDEKGIKNRKIITGIRK